MTQRGYYKQNIEIALKEYLKFNTTPDISPTTLWEVHKPVLHGTCLYQANVCNRERNAMCHTLETKCNSCHMAFQQNSSPSSRVNLDKAKLEFDSADKIIRKSKHNFYMNANKPNMLLAQTLKSCHISSKPIRLRLSRDVYTINLMKILQKFKTQLKSLYSSDKELDQSKANDFFPISPSLHCQRRNLK